MCTSAIRYLVRSARPHQIYSLMQTGGQYGMQTMDQGLAKLVKTGRITEAVAFDRCRNEEDLRNHLKLVGAACHGDDVRLQGPRPHRQARRGPVRGRQPRGRW